MYIDHTLESEGLHPPLPVPAAGLLLERVAQVGAVARELHAAADHRRRRVRRVGARVGRQPPDGVRDRRLVGLRPRGVRADDLSGPRQPRHGARGEVGEGALDQADWFPGALRDLLSDLLPRLNNRLTTSASTIGDPSIKAGRVVNLDGVGDQFGGLYRITEATHTFDGSGYRTTCQARKEVWFGSIPVPKGASGLFRVQGQGLG